MIESLLANEIHGERPMRHRHYILEGKEPKPVDLLTWARWFETAQRHVANATMGDVRVSTVFLGLDYNFGPDGPPLLFETMIFGGEHDQDCERYATWDEALAGHCAAMVKAGIAGTL